MVWLILLRCHHNQKCTKTLVFGGVAAESCHLWSSFDLSCENKQPTSQCQARKQQKWCEKSHTKAHSCSNVRWTFTWSCCNSATVTWSVCGLNLQHFDLRVFFFFVRLKDCEGYRVRFFHTFFANLRKCPFFWWLSISTCFIKAKKTIQAQRHSLAIIQIICVCFVLSLSSSCPGNLQFCLWFPLWLHWASGRLAWFWNHRHFLWVNWNPSMLILQSLSLGLFLWTSW